MIIFHSTKIHQTFPREDSLYPSHLSLPFFIKKKKDEQTEEKKIYIYTHISASFVPQDRCSESARCFALKKIGGTFEALILVDPEQNHATWMPFACQAQREQQRASFSIYIVQRDIGQRPLFRISNGMYRV